MQGLVTRDRANTIDEHKLPWCHDVMPAPDVLTSIRSVKPTVYLDIASMVPFHLYSKSPSVSFCSEVLNGNLSSSVFLVRSPICADMAYCLLPPLTCEFAFRKCTFDVVWSFFVCSACRSYLAVIEALQVVLPLRKTPITLVHAADINLHAVCKVILCLLSPVKPLF